MRSNNLNLLYSYLKKWIPNCSKTNKSNCNPVQSVYLSGDSETIEGHAEENIDGWGIPSDKKTYFLEFNK